MLRDYQSAAVEAVIGYWRAGGGNPLVEMPTGSGKSLTCAGLIKELCRISPNVRIIVATHVQELVDQDYSALMQLWPEADAGIYSAGLSRRDTRAQIIFASVQSIFRNPAVLGPRHVLWIDEAHLLSRKADGMYQQLIDRLKAHTPNLRVGGMTATCFRLDSGLLTESWKTTPPLFDEVVHTVPITMLLEKQFLSPLVTRGTKTKLDVTGVRKSGGEFVSGELERAVDKDNINRGAMAEYLRSFEDGRVAGIAFAAGVDHAHHLAAIASEHGHNAQVLTAETSKSDRGAMVRDFKARKIQSLIGVGVLTTGFDAPHVDVIACLRPTQSKGLWIQMVGRGLRVSPGKTNCLVLDFAGNTYRHGPIDLVDGSKTPGEGTAPMRECPTCQSIILAALHVCPTCGHEFPRVRAKELTDKAGVDPLLSTDSVPVWFNVDDIIYRRHVKFGSPDSLRVDYICGATVKSEWVLLEHESMAWRARRWWERRSTRALRSGTLLGTPLSIDEALTRTEELRKPGRISVQRTGKFWNVNDYDFSIPAACDLGEKVA